jgi:hypothetical protein
MDNDCLQVKAFETSKSKVKTRKAMDNHLIPKHPFRLILSGSSGSGKSNLLLHLLTQKQLYKGYFDIIFIISPTAGKLDDSYSALAKHKGKTVIRIINDLNADLIEQIMATNKKLILNNQVHKAPKILIVYDDVVADKKFMGMKSFLHSFIASRHYNASVIICTQKFNSVPRTCRLQANAIMYFRGTNGERETLVNEFSPAGYNKKETSAIFDYATRDPYSFLYINLMAPRSERYRKNLKEILRLKR